MPAANGKKKYGIGKSNELMDLDLPSGNMCQVRRPGVQGLIKAGILDNLDALTSLVQKNLDTANPMKVQKAVADLAMRPEDLTRGMDLTDKVVEHVVTQPRVIRPIQRDVLGKPILKDGKEVPLEDAERDPEHLYTDDVDLDDKMFIVQFVMGGTRDLESFRQQQQELLGGLADGHEAEVPPQ